VGLNDFKEAGNGRPGGLEKTGAGGGDGVRGSTAVNVTDVATRSGLPLATLTRLLTFRRALMVRWERFAFRVAAVGPVAPLLSGSIHERSVAFAQRLKNNYTSVVIVNDAQTDYNVKTRCGLIFIF
jgi:hypothetical protein